MQHPFDVKHKSKKRPILLDDELCVSQDKSPKVVYEKKIDLLFFPTCNKILKFVLQFEFLVCEPIHTLLFNEETN